MKKVRFVIFAGILIAVVGALFYLQSPHVAERTPVRGVGVDVQSVEQPLFTAGSPRTREAALGLIGVWVSTEDEGRYEIMFFPDGVYKERYGEEETGRGTWRVADGADVPQAAYASTSGQVFLIETAIYPESANSVFVYELATVSDTHLEMYYVGRGNRLSFTRK
jgi:hypothetical protein